MAYVLITIGWNLGVKAYIALCKNEVASQILNRDMDPTIRSNQRRYNFPILRNMTLIASFIFLTQVIILTPIHHIIRKSNNLWYIHINNQMTALFVTLLYVFVSLPICDDIKRKLQSIFPAQVFME